MDEPVALSVAAEKILSEAAPLALLDTCSLLDILRAPLRKNIPDSIIAAAQMLKTLRMRVQNRSGSWVRTRSASNGGTGSRA